MTQCHFEFAALSEHRSPFVNSFGCLGLPRRGLDTVVCTRGALPTLGAEEDQPHSVICLLNVPLTCSKSWCFLWSGHCCMHRETFPMIEAVELYRGSTLWRHQKPAALKKAEDAAISTKSRSPINPSIFFQLPAYILANMLWIFYHMNKAKPEFNCLVIFSSLQNFHWV